MKIKVEIPHFIKRRKYVWGTVLLIGALYLPSGCGRNFDYGFYQDGRRNLWITKGTGNSIVNARLLCDPEILILTPHPAR